MSTANRAKVLEADPLLSTEETAQYTNTSTQHLGLLRHRGTGPKFIKFSPKKVLYRKSDVDSWLAERTRTITE